MPREIANSSRVPCETLRQGSFIRILPTQSASSRKKYYAQRPAPGSPEVCGARQVHSVAGYVAMRNPAAQSLPGYRKLSPAFLWRSRILSRQGRRFS